MLSAEQVGVHTRVVPGGMVPGRTYPIPLPFRGSDSTNIHGGRSERIGSAAHRQGSVIAPSLVALGRAGHVHRASADRFRVGSIGTIGTMQFTGPDCGNLCDFHRKVAGPNSCSKEPI